MQLPETGQPDPVLAGALRVSEALEGGATSLVGVWQKAPMQALARLHALAAADLVDDDRLGRPRADADVGPRLELLVDMVTGKSDVPATVLAAVAHGELLTLAPFGTADGLVARGGVAVGDDREWVGSARSRRSRGVLDAAFRRLPGRCARIRVGYSRRIGRLVGAELSSVAGRRERGAVDRGRRVEIASQQSEAGDAPKLVRLVAR